MLSLISSVGRGGSNLAPDVLIIQGLLNQSLGVPYRHLEENGKQCEDLAVLIEEYQTKVGHRPLKPGIIMPGDQLWQSLSGKFSLPRASGSDGLSEDDYKDAATVLGCELAAIVAVAKVESPKGAFLASGRPTLLFEAHIFSRKTKHIYDTVAPDISSRKWNKKLYAGGEMEFDRIQKAMCLNRQAALLSASYGRFQIMGFNYQAAGYASVEAFVVAMFQSERYQLEAFVSFIRNEQLTGALKNRQWAKFARGYNGPEYAENRYDTKIRDAYEMVKVLEFDRALRMQGMALV